MIKVLIADDEPLLLRSLKKSIEMMDGEYSVIDTASDGKSALKKAEALNPDVIFTDIRMPIFDGLEFVGKLREKGICQKSYYAGSRRLSGKAYQSFGSSEDFAKNESRIAGGYSRKTGSISSSRNSWWQNRNGRLFF